MRKLTNILILVPLAIVLILLSVANRQSATFNLDPTNIETPALSFTLPFFIFLFIALFAGMFLGSCLTWLNQGKHRKALREKSYEVNQLHRQSERSEASTVSVKEIAPGLPAVTKSKAA